MIRYFLVMAVTGGSLLAADLVLGFLAAVEAPGLSTPGRDVHKLVSLVTIVALLGIHSIVYTYFLATRKWAQEVVRVYQLPDGFNVQAKQNKRRAFRYVLGSMTVIAVVTWLGGAVDTLSPAYAPWHLGAAVLALAVNLGAFAAEYGVIVAHARLLVELKDRADRMRAERYGPEPAAVGRQ